MLYLYRHIRLDKNAPFYIGIGSYRKNRSDTLERAYSKNCRSEFWHRVANKSEYRVEIMLEDLTADEAKKREQEFISLYGGRNIGTGSLVNLTDGGDGVFGLSAETRKIMSNKAKISSTGRTHTQETKDKLRSTRIGVPLSPAHKAKVIAQLVGVHESNKVKIERFDLLTGETIESYNSLRDAEKDGYSLTNISELINGRRGLKSHKGFGWRKVSNVLISE